MRKTKSSMGFQPMQARVENPCYKILMMILALCAASSSAQTIEVKNNQPFPIAMPWTMRDIGGKDAAVLVNVGANATQTIDLAAATQDAQASVTIEPVENGVHLKTAKQDLGTLSWGIVFEKLTKEQAKPGDEKAAAVMHDIAKVFKPLKLTFLKSGGEKLFDTWSAGAL